MNPAHLEILMCPKTKGSLRIATEAEISSVNARIERGDLSIDPLEAGLFCDSGGLLYPVRDGIPVLLASEAIPSEPASDPTTPSESSK
jgi:uncharacterized protein YbaR (Trm112 family)